MGDTETGKAPEDGWRNRIVETGTADPKELKANPLNWRRHPKLQQEILTGVLDDVGWVDRILVNRRTGLMIDGHLRVEMALKRGETEVPVDYVDLDADEERKVLATFDPISALATSNRERLGQLLDGLSSKNKAVNELLDKLRPTDGADKGGLLELAQVTVADPQHEVHYGDVWIVGSHVLVCREVLTDWKHWVKYLEGEHCIFAPYPGPFAALTQEAELKRLVMVQPDPYIAGHILDRWAEQRGEDEVRRCASESK